MKKAFQSQFCADSIKNILNHRDAPIKFSKDDLFFYLNNRFVKTSVKNPFKKNSFEYALTQGVIKSCERINLHLKDNKTRDIGISIVLDILKKQTIFSPLIAYEAMHLFQRGLWLCLLHSLLKIENVTTKEIEIPQFGVYLESGMFDILSSKKYIEKLKKIEPLEARHHLWKVLLLADIVYQNAGIIRVGYDQTSIYKNYEKELGITQSVIDEIYPEKTSIREGLTYITNLDNNRQLMHERLHSIPIYPWFATRADVDADPTMRNIFHHIGDELGFILAAIQVGDCYILGSDEFGGHQVLGVFPSLLRNVPELKDFPVKNDSLEYQNFMEDLEKRYKLGKKAYYSLFQEVNTSSFAYVYSVPRTTSFYLTQDAFQVSSYLKEKNDCLINNEENSKLHNEFWKNDIFLQHASRELKSVSTKEFLSMLRDKLKNQFIEQFSKQKWNEFCIFVNQYISFSLSSASEGKADLSIDLHKELIKWIDLLKSEDINKTKSATTLFFKSVAHKVHCDIINPIKIESLGFFKKNNEQTKYAENVQNDDVMKKATQINLSRMVNDLLLLKAKQDLIKLTGLIKLESSEEKSTENFIEFYIFSELIKKDHDLPQFLSYWLSQKEETIIYSELIDMKYEYRIFMVNGKPAATSACFRNTTPLNAWNDGVFDPRISDGHSASYFFNDTKSRKLVAKYAKFARNFGKEMKNKYPEIKNYVLDVAWCESKQEVVPIEINSLTWSGAYQINMERLVFAIAGKKYDGKKSLTKKLMNKIDENLHQMTNDVILSKIKTTNDDAFSAKEMKIKNIQSLVSDIIQQDILLQEKNELNLEDSDFFNTDNMDELEFVQEVREIDSVSLDSFVNEFSQENEENKLLDENLQAVSNQNPSDQHIQQEIIELLSKLPDSENAEQILNSAFSKFLEKLQSSEELNISNISIFSEKKEK